MFIPETKTATLYHYHISGFYWHGQYGIEVKDHFDKFLWAEDNIVAMKQVLGEIAWKCSLEGETFRMEHIHYDVLNH